MDPVTLFILSTIVSVLFIGAFLGMVYLAVLIYVVKNLYPPVRKVALLAAKLETFLPLLILAVVLLFLIIIIVVFALKLPAIVALLLILVVLVLVICLIVVDVVLLLGVSVYAIRIVGWLYGRWKGLLGGLWTSVMILKIKHDVDKDKGKGKGIGKGKDLTTHFADMKRKLSEEADQARHKISKGGK